MVATFYIKKFFACSRSLLALHFIRIDYGEDNNNNDEYDGKINKQKINNGNEVASRSGEDEYED